MPSSSDTIDAFYEASVRPDLWESVLAQTARRFEAETGAFYVETPRGTIEAPIATDISVMVGHSAKAIDDYCGYYAQRNPFAFELNRFAVGAIATDTKLDRIAGLRPFAQSEYYCDWVQPQGQRHVIGQYMRRTGRGVLTVALWRPASTGPYAQGEVEDFAVIMRHAARAIDIGARLSTAEAEMEAILARLPVAVLTLGRDGRVKQTNAVADALLKAGDGLSSREGHLRTAIADDQPGLDRLLACALDRRFAAWAENARVPVRRKNGRAPLLARVVAVCERFDPFAPDRSASLVLIVEGCDARGAIAEDRLRRRFGLTPAQFRVASSLRDGRTLSETAAALGISRETVRTHLRVVFAKTGTRRQTDLVMLLERETAL